MKKLILAAVAVLAVATVGLVSAPGAGAAHPCQNPAIPSGNGETLTWADILPANVPGDPYVIRPTEGGAPLADVIRRGNFVSTIELLQFPLESLDGADERGLLFLGDFVRDYYEGVKADRKATYGRDYTFRADTPRWIAVGDHCGITFGFTGFHEGHETERYVNYVTVDSETFYLVGAFYDEAYGGELGFPTIRSLRAFEPRLAVLIGNLNIP